MSNWERKLSDWLDKPATQHALYFTIGTLGVVATLLGIFAFAFHMLQLMFDAILSGYGGQL